MDAATMKTFLTYTISVLAFLVAGLQLVKAHLDKKAAEVEKQEAALREEKNLAALNKISLEKDAALADLKAAQEKFTALSRYSAQLDDKLAYVLCGFDFERPLSGTELAGTTTLFRFPAVGGVFTVVGLPVQSGTPPKPADVAFQESCWPDGDQTKKPLVKVESPLVGSYSRAAVNLLELGKLSGAAKATKLRDLHRSMIEIYADERTVRLAKKFVVIANGLVVMSLPVSPTDWEKKADGYWTSNFAGGGLYQLNLANNDGALIPMLLIDLHSQIPQQAN